MNFDSYKCQYIARSDTYSPVKKLQELLERDNAGATAGDRNNR